MITRICTQLALVTVLALSGAAHAALQGRDLNGNMKPITTPSSTSQGWLMPTTARVRSMIDTPYYGGTTTDGKMTWNAANTWAANQSFTDAVNNITYDNWRLL